MGGRHGVFLTAEDLMLGMERLDRTLSPAVTEVPYTDRHEHRYPEKGEDY
jgi:hypothetical protein